ncbi:MAG TPA: sugar ABC transporter permease [Anaerolineae bacterium]
MMSRAITSAARPQLLRGRLGRRLREIALGYLFLLPAFAILAVFEFFPVFYGAYISTCNWKISGCAQFLGLGNYARAFADPDMWHSLLITASYAILSVPIQLGLALIIAYLLFQNFRGKSFYRILFFLPYITSSVASSAVWAQLLFSPDKGIINEVLTKLGLPALKWLGEGRGIFDMLAGAGGVHLPEWAGGPSLALISIIIYTTWVFVGYDATIFLAGLGNIPGELYEVARIDGANGWQLFRYITIPLLSPTTFLLLLLTVIGTFKAFNHIYVMTLGGPGTATTTTAIMIFKQMFEFNRYGYSAALSFILFTVILILTVVQNRVAGSRVVYT